MIEAIAVSEKMQTTIDSWRDIVAGIDDWQKVVEGLQPDPEAVDSGDVYDLPDFVPNNTESFAIVDLSRIAQKGGVDEPHYHKRIEESEGEVEVHIPISGRATMVVGQEAYEIGEDGLDHLVIPPEVAHFIIPGEGFVDGVVSIPSFDPENYVVVDPDGEIPETVQFDKARYAAALAIQSS